MDFARSASKAHFTARIQTCVILTACACSIAGGGHAAEPRDPYARQFLKQAEDASFREDDGAVLELVRKVLQNDPKSARAYALRAKSFMHRKRYDRAVADADKAISLDPHMALAYVVRGKSGYLGGESSNEQVTSDLKTAVRLDPKIPDGYFSLGVIATVEKDYQRSVDLFSKALTLQPKDSAIFQYRSAAYTLLHKDELAIKDLDMVIKLKPLEYQGYVTRADALTRLKRFDDAIADYTAAIKCEPRQYITRMYRATLFIKLGRYKDAVNDYTEAINLNPLDEDLFLRRGNTYVLMKDYQHALTDYNEALSLSDEYESAFRQRGKLYELMGKKDLAAKDMARAAELKKRPAEKKI